MHGLKSSGPNAALVNERPKSYLTGTGDPARNLWRPYMRKIGTPVISFQAPESTGPAPSSKAEKAKRADHDLLNAAGEVVEDEEDANGIRYKLLALPDRPFTWQFGTNPTVDKFLAIFGAKTLATNEASAVRNSPKGEGTAEEQVDAIEARFALLATGKWVDRTREGVGAKVDLDALANAICNVMVAEGKLTDADVSGGKLAAYRQKLDDDKTFARQARSHPPFAAEYAKIKGKTAVTLDDFTI